MTAKELIKLLEHAVDLLEKDNKRVLKEQDEFWKKIEQKRKNKYNISE